MFRVPDEELFKRFTHYTVIELGRSPRTAFSYVQAVTRASAYIGKPASKVHASDLRQVLSSNYAASTKRGMVVAFRQFHLWGVVEGLWTQNGLTALKTPKVPRNPLPPLGEHEPKRILALARTPVEVRTTFLGLYAGLRISESASINENSWQGGWLTVLGKGRKLRRVPVHPELAKVRTVILSRKPSYRTLEVTWGRFRDRHAFKNRDGGKPTTHTLRRTFATRIYEKAPWEVVARLLGHGEDVTAAYAQITDESLVEPVHGLNYYRGEPIQLTLF